MNNVSSYFVSVETISPGVLISLKRRLYFSAASNGRQILFNAGEIMIHLRIENGLPVSTYTLLFFHHHLHGEVILFVENSNFGRAVFNSENIEIIS